MEVAFRGGIAVEVGICSWINLIIRQGRLHRNAVATSKRPAAPQKAPHFSQSTKHGNMAKEWVCTPWSSGEEPGRYEKYGSARNHSTISKAGTSPPSYTHFSETHMEFSKEKVAFCRVLAWWKRKIGKVARGKKSSAWE